MLCGKEYYDNVDQFTFDYTERLIKNYCHLDYIPEELEETLIDMVCEIEKTRGYGQSEKTGAIGAITEGDISVSFKDISENMLDIKDFRKQLENFRRPKW